MEFIRSNNKYIELKDDNTYVTHNVQFVQQGSNIMRIDRDPQGKEIPSIIQPYALVTVDDTTGEIFQEQHGFSPEHEILGPPIHHEVGKKYIKVLESDFPADYRTKDPVTDFPKLNYKFNKITKKLEKKL